MGRSRCFCDLTFFPCVGQMFAHLLQGGREGRKRGRGGGREGEWEGGREGEREGGSQGGGEGGREGGGEGRREGGRKPGREGGRERGMFCCTSSFPPLLPSLPPSFHHFNLYYFLINSLLFLSHLPVALPPSFLN